MHNCPRKIFIEYLVKFISQLRAEGHEIILVADINNNSIDSRLNKALHQVGLIEAFYRKF